MNEQPPRNARRRTTKKQALHPVLDFSPKLRARADALKLSCHEPAWLGWGVPHRFSCTQGHELRHAPGALLSGSGVCRLCRAAQCMKRLQAQAVEAGAVCLDSTWLGYKAQYRFRCEQGHEWSRSTKRRPGCPVCIKAAADEGRRLQDGLQRLINRAQELGGACLSEAYLGRAQYHHFRCAEGHEWQTAAGEVLRGAWCRLCANARKRTQYRLADGLQRLQQAAADKGGVCLSDTYDGAREHYDFRCEKGHEWHTQGALVLRGGWCRACADARKSERLLHKTGLRRLQEMATSKGGVCLSESYLGSAHRHRFRCQHGHEWDALAAPVLQNGSWCSICARTSRRLGLEAAQAAAQARGGKCLSETYVGTHAKMNWMCDRGHTWPARFGQIRRGQWCPDCAHMAQITNKNSEARPRYGAAGYAA